MGRCLQAAAVSGRVSVGTDKSGAIETLLTQKFCFFISAFQEHPRLRDTGEECPRVKILSAAEPTQCIVSFSFQASRLPLLFVDFEAEAMFWQCVAAWNWVVLTRESSELGDD